MLLALFQAFFAPIGLLLLGGANSIGASLLVWFLRIVTFSLLFRTYIGPWLFAVFSKRIRVRSISVRSVRGIYFRQGILTWRADRISYSMYSPDGSTRWAIRVDGMSLEVGKPDVQTPPPVPVTRHRRNLTLADLNPSPLARWLWEFIYAIYLLVEPYFRPIIRTYVVACLRLAIRWLPGLAKSMSFDFYSNVVTFEGIPDTKIDIDHITLHTSLAFTDLERAINADDVENMSNQPKGRAFYGVAAWRKRMTDGFQRALDRAWGEAHGTASVMFNLRGITGMTHQDSPSDHTVPFFVSPGSIDFAASVRFNPKAGKIDDYSLESQLHIGDCSVKVDLMNKILGILKKQTFASAVIPPSTYPDSPLQSSFSFLSSRASWSLPSSALPISPLTSPSVELSPPKSTAVLEPLSPLMMPKSPGSPFLRAISASIRVRRPHLIKRCVRLKDTKNQSKISVLRSVSISVSTITLTTSADRGTGSYRATVRNVSLEARLSDPSLDKLHQQWLGRGQKEHCYDPDIYAFNFNVQKIMLERLSKREDIRLLRLGPLDFEAVASQYPAPWLMTTPFLDGDPNAPFVAARISVGAIQFTEQLDELRRMLNDVPISKEPPAARTSFPLPRFSFEAHCDSVLIRITTTDTTKRRRFAMELRNRGFIISAKSNYDVLPMSSVTCNMASGCVNPARLNCTYSVVVEPTDIRIRQQWSTVATGKRLEPSEPDFTASPSLLSLGTLELSGKARAPATVDISNIACVEVPSVITQTRLHCSSLCVELWHSDVISAVSYLLSLSSNSRKDVVSLPPSSPISRLPSGLSVMLALSRCVLFVTAPDINPSDRAELCRGISLRTDLSAVYSAVRMVHLEHGEDPGCSRKRSKLNLPQEAITDVIDACKKSGSSVDIFARLNVSLSRAVLRSAVASRREPDDPNMAKHDTSFESLEFLRAGNARASVFVSSQNGTVGTGCQCICDVDTVIQEVWADFELAHVYNTLLALRTVRQLLPEKKEKAPRRRSSKQNIPLNVNVKLATMQIMCNFLKEKLAVRIDDINAGIKPDSQPAVSFDRAISWVPIHHLSPWERKPTSQKWGEFVTLNRWLVNLDIQPGMLPSIKFDGNGARLRIPHGFVLADLIFDISVVVKALRHTVHMTAAGIFSDMPSPEPEGPKLVPKLTFNIQCLCLEAQDDPFEATLGLIWREGREAAARRREREEAFLAKVAAIRAAEGYIDIPDGDQGYRFNSVHSVSIDEARHRLNDVHQLDWSLRLEKGRDAWSKEENKVSHELSGSRISRRSKSKISNIVPENAPSHAPPLFRVVLSDVDLNITPPSFAPNDLPLFMHTHGNGLPTDTLFSLLIPMHISLSLSSLRVTLRDYPLPLISIPIAGDSDGVAFSFDADLVIGEEMGTDLSVDWIPCLVIGEKQGANPLFLSVPKTIMPVKTYANPIIRVPTSKATLLSWSVSYGPAIQDVMRIIDTLSTPPRDASPALGFWDKLRLVFHWRAKILFQGDVRLYLKGSRNPYKLNDDGAGFVLCWQGSPELCIGYPNDEGELIQVISNSMLIAIPKLGSPVQVESAQPISYSFESSEPFQKVCAEFGSGTRFGVGFVLERACGYECHLCAGLSDFHRKCRFFNFKPHYAVKLEKKLIKPERKGPDDSYNGFRSDFIHLSVSLTSSLTPSLASTHNTSSLHLTPKAFAHFFSWWSLFDNVLTLPIRQGNYYPARHVSPKLGRHLATLKYRIHVRRLSVIHAYIDDSRETWVDGVTPWVGMKGMIDEFHVDMHQRDEETFVVGPSSNTVKIIHRKPFYAAEVVLKSLELKALLATFPETLKQAVEMTAPSQRSNYRKRTNIPITSMSSYWYDAKDFIEVDWSPQEEPTLHLLPLATCPHFTYYKRNSALTSPDSAQTSKFGIEHSHVCLLGKEPTVLHVQVELALERIEELKEQVNKKKRGFDRQALDKMIALLEEYVSVLKEAEENPKSARSSNDQNQHYHMPSDIVSPDEWAEFDNVYQIHCPNIFMDSATRDIVLQYYYCSRARRGFEYHMATRAVKFIRDQAEAALPDAEVEEEPEKGRISTNTAQIAASAIRKMLKGDNQKASVEINNDAICEIPDGKDPLEGWAEGVSLKRNHCCLLLKPQIIMRGEGIKEACIVAAAHAKLQSYAIMDNANLKDSVSGKVMSRNYSSVSGLQAFATERLHNSGNGHVPLEVLVDLRCESSDFERLVPQTDAKFHYDKFNRLRLRNNTTSVAMRASADRSLAGNHLQDQTDLIRVHIPKFTVSANDEHFHIISNIVTKLLLFSDAAHKTRLDRLETLLFTYDFTDLESAANVVSDLQGRLRDAMKSERMVMRNPRRLEEDADRLALMKLKAHIFLLVEELNLLFDAIKLAQDRFDDQTDRKSALLLHASSSEISWRMLDERRNLLAKLVVQDINFYWLSRQDSSIVNNLAVGDLTAFDGSRHAIWAEILSKHYEPANHPLLKRGLFLLANWTILPPVGGIAIYECFELNLHPLRLQIDAKVGRRIMEYVWPARRDRIEGSQPTTPATPATSLKVVVKSPVSSRSSLDSPRALHSINPTSAPKENTLTPPLRKLGVSRSFTDLRSSKDTRLLKPFTIQRTHSSESLVPKEPTQAVGSNRKLDDTEGIIVEEDSAGDAAVMKTRSSQKTFVLVKISSLDVLLSIVKEGSFEFHDARIKTRELEYHNQTWSFEELVNEFIPSNMGWKGWVKMALHQPLIPVLPVARELISKTKWTTGSKAHPHEHPLQLLHPGRFLGSDDDTLLGHKSKKGKGRHHNESGPKHLTSLPFTSEPEPIDKTIKVTNSSRKRVFNIFNRPQTSKGGESKTVTPRTSDSKDGS